LDFDAHPKRRRDEGAERKRHAQGNRGAKRAPPPRLDAAIRSAELGRLRLFRLLWLPAGPVAIAHGDLLFGTWYRGVRLLSRRPAPSLPLANAAGRPSTLNRAPGQRVSRSGRECAHYFGAAPGSWQPGTASS